MLIPVSVTSREPEKEYSANSMDTASNSLKRKFLGAGILLALSAILLPLLLDGSGSESRFRRVENLREQPPRVIGADGVLEAPRVVQRSDSKGFEFKLINPSSPRNKPLPRPDTSVKAPAATTVVLGTEKIENPSRPRTVSELLASRSLGNRDDVENTVPAKETVSSSGESDKAVRAGNLPGAGPWLIQAASFSDELRATTLRNQLRDRGYPSFVTSAWVQLSSADTPRYRVQVGPLTDRIKTVQRKREIERIVGGRSLVTVYQQ